MSHHENNDAPAGEGPGLDDPVPGPEVISGEPRQAPKQKQSWAAVGASVRGNRGAVIMIGAVVVAGGTFLSMQNRSALEAAPTSNTDVSAIAMPVSDERSKDDPRVAHLDGEVENEALQVARDIGGTYVAPIAPTSDEDLVKPVAAPSFSASPPSIAAAQQRGQAKSQSSGLDDKALEREQKRAEEIQKAMQRQLAKLSNQVSGQFGAPGISEVEKPFSVNAPASYTGASVNVAQQDVRLGFPMGTIWEATLITGADTDRPGTIRARIDQGPFAGREALCKFDWASREYLAIECFSIKLDSESLPVQMIAVDADTMPNLKANYEGRYIKRLGGQFLAAFPAAYAEGLAMGGSTVSTASSTTQTEKELSGGELAIYATGRATAPLLSEAQAIANEIKPRASVPPMQMIGLMLAEDI